MLPKSYQPPLLHKKGTVARNVYTKIHRSLVDKRWVVHCAYMYSRQAFRTWNVIFFVYWFQDDKNQIITTNVWIRQVYVIVHFSIKKPPPNVLQPQPHQYEKPKWMPEWRLFFHENQTLYLLFRFRNGPIFCWRGNQSTMEASNEFVLTRNFFGFQMLFCITGQFASLTTKFYRDQTFSFGWFPCLGLGWRGWKRYVALAVASSAYPRF